MKESVTVSKNKQQNLKKLDWDLIRQFASSLEDIKKGRFKKLA